MQKIIATQQTQDLELSHLENGVYFIRLQNNNLNIVERIVVKH